MVSTISSALLCHSEKHEHPLAIAATATHTHTREHTLNCLKVAQQRTYSHTRSTVSSCAAAVQRSLHSHRDITLPCCACLPDYKRPTRPKARHIRDKLSPARPAPRRPVGSRRARAEILSSCVHAGCCLTVTVGLCTPADKCVTACPGSAAHCALL